MKNIEREIHVYQNKEGWVERMRKEQVVFDYPKVDTKK